MEMKIRMVYIYLDEIEEELTELALSLKTFGIITILDDLSTKVLLDDVEDEEEQLEITLFVFSNLSHNSEALDDRA